MRIVCHLSLKFALEMTPEARVSVTVGARPRRQKSVPCETAVTASSLPLASPSVPQGGERRPTCSKAKADSARVFSDEVKQGKDIGQ